MNILLIQLKRIGDLILTTPAIAALRQKFPDAKITLVVSPAGAPLAAAIPGLDRTLVLHRGLSDVTTFLAIARTKYDYCVDFTRNNRSAFVALLSRAQKRVASYRVKRRSRFRQKAYTDFVPYRMRDMHMMDYNLALLGPLGIRDLSPPLALSVPPTAQERAHELRRAHLQGDFVIFHPGSARIEKFWQPDRWAEVISATARWNLTAVLTGGDSPQEKTHLAEIESQLPRPTSESAAPVVDLSGKMDLLTLAALIGQARLLVTVDSAPMHLAAATRTPQVVLFGPTNPFHWYPRQSPAVILQGDSALSVREFVPKQHALPMKLISTQAVINAMDSLLSAPTAQPL